MNKYQLTALNFLGIDPKNFGKTISLKTGRATKGLHIVDDSIIVFDDRDINSKEYELRLFVGLYAKIELFVGGKWVAFENKNHQYQENGKTENFNGVVAPINLDKRPNKLKIIVPNKVCEDIIVEIKYDVISEEEYWKIQNSPETLRNNMSVTYRTGDNLVNIYWKHAKENIVTLVRIDLYMGTPSSCQLMGKYKVSDEVFFKAIDGLAYGKYCFKVLQFDKDNNEIASTDFIEFSISKPNQNDGSPTGFTSGGGGLHGHKGIVIG
jgi:hypothetical protein